MKSFAWPESPRLSLVSRTPGTSHLSGGRLSHREDHGRNHRAETTVRGAGTFAESGGLWASRGRLLVSGQHLVFVAHVRLFRGQGGSNRTAGLGYRVANDADRREQGRSTAP